MKIDLVIPPSAFLIDDRCFPFLGPLQIAATARERGHDVRVHDLTGYKRRHPSVVHADPHAVLDEAAGLLRAGLEARQPDLVGFYSLAAQHPHVVQLHRQARAWLPGAKHVLGGPHANTAPDRCLADGFDHVVVADQGGGGGEAGFVELLEGMGRSKRSLLGTPGVVKVPSRKGVSWENDAHPLPARDLIDLNSYHYAIEGERATSVVSATGCPYACTYSVTGDTLIATDRGFERIDSMVAGVASLEQCVHGAAVHLHKLGREVATADGRAIAAHVVYEGIRPVFEVRAENGLRIKATAEHPLMVVRGDSTSWKRVDELKVGDWLVLRTPDRVWPTVPEALPVVTLPAITRGGGNANPHTIRYDTRVQTPAVFDEDVAWFVGYMIGDGCIPLDGRPAIHVCVTPRDKSRLLRSVRKCFGKKLKLAKASNTDKMLHGWLYSREARAFLTDVVGIDPSKKLRVPEIVRRAPKSVVRAFIDGLLAADGYFPKRGNPYLTTVSWELAREVAHLHTMLGDVPTIVEVKPHDVSRQTAYRVSTFANDRIPTTKAIYKSSKSGKWYWRTPRSAHFLGVRRRTLIESNLDHPLLKNGWHYVRVEAINPGLCEPVYDLRVPGDHNFLADGIVSHNCSHWEGYRKLEAKSSPRVREELRQIRARYGWRAFMFYDDEINLRPDFATEFLPMLRGEGCIWRAFFKNGKNLTKESVFEAMAASGCVQLCTGAESADPGILKAIRKGATVEDNTLFVRLCTKHRIKPKVFTQVGLPGETPDTIEALRRWLVQMASEGLTDADVSITTPYEGTPIFEKPEQHAITFDKSKLDWSNDVVLYKGTPGEYKSYVSHPLLSADDLVAARQMVEDEFRKAAGLKPLLAKDDG